MSALKVLSWNIDTNIIRIEEKDAVANQTHEPWQVRNRALATQNTLNQVIEQEGLPDIMHIQECRQFVNNGGILVDSITPLADHLRTLGYEILISPYNTAGGDRAFKYITAYRPERLAFKDSSLKLFTQTPDQATPRPEGDPNAEDSKRIKEHNFGTFWEKGVFINEFVDKQTGQPIVSMNAHLDIVERTRIESSRLLGEFAHKILINNPDASIVLTGDFNTFPGKKDDVQINYITGATFQNAPIFTEVTDSATFPDGSPATGSFLAFPYDPFVDDMPVDVQKMFGDIQNIDERRQAIDHFYAARSLANTGLLDRAFVHGLIASGCKVLPIPLFPELFKASTVENQPYSEASLKQYIVAANEQHHKPAFASDHQPLMFKVTSAVPAFPPQDKQIAAM